MTGENDDPLIQPIVERIKAFALEWGHGLNR
jgi:hypothetical protein